MMLDLSPAHGWRPPIVKTAATGDVGVEDALAALESHGKYLAESGEALERRRRRARARLLAILEERFRGRVERDAPRREGLEEATRRVAARGEAPAAAAARLPEQLPRGGRRPATKSTTSAAPSSR